MYTSNPTTPSKKDKSGQKGHVLYSTHYYVLHFSTYYTYILLLINLILHIYTYIGLISTLEFNPDYSGCYAAGSYNNNIHIYVENMIGSALEISNLDAGVSSLKWSKCGLYLYIGLRKYNHIIVYDVRTNRCEVGRIVRSLTTNQRLSFDIHPTDSILMTGSEDEGLLFYDTITYQLLSSHQLTNHATTSTAHPTSSYKSIKSPCINTAQYCPTDPNMIGICIGQRTYPLPHSTPHSTSTTTPVFHHTSGAHSADSHNSDAESDVDSNTGDDEKYTTPESYIELYTITGDTSSTAVDDSDVNGESVTVCMTE